MIFTERQITVRKGKATIDEPVILYRGDYEVSIKFTIMESKFRFKSGVNLVDSEKASFGQLAILAPYGGNVFSEVVKCEDGTVTFTLTKEMIDQLEEVGLYSFQIRLFDYYKESRVSIPPVEFGIEVREPVASEDHDNTVNNAIVGYSIAKVVDGLSDDVPDTFDDNGQYNKTNWETGDRISEGKLNKIEDALDKINQNEINDKNSLNKQMTSNFNVLQSQIDNMVIESGNADAEVEQARGEYNLLNQRLNAMDETDAELVSQLAHNAKYRTNVLSLNIEPNNPNFDSSTIIQNEINKLHELGGGILEFPSGSYYFEDTIILKPNVSLIGSGNSQAWNGNGNLGYEKGTVFYHIPVIEKDFLTLSNEDELIGYIGSISLKNIYVCGNENSQVGLKLINLVCGNIENLCIKGFNVDLNIQGSMKSVFKNITCQYARGKCLDISGAISTTTTLYDCYFGQSESGCLNIDNNTCLGVNFINCIFESAKEGLLIGSSNVISFTNIYTENIPSLSSGGVTSNPIIEIGRDDSSQAIKGAINFIGGVICGSNEQLADDSITLKVNYCDTLTFNNVTFERCKTLLDSTSNSKKISFIACNEVEITYGLFNDESIRNKADIISCYSTAYGNITNNSLNHIDVGNYKIENVYSRTENDLSFTLPSQTPTLLLDNNKNIQLFGQNTNHENIKGGGSLIINPTDPTVAGQLNSTLLFSKDVDGELMLHQYTNKHRNRIITVNNFGSTSERMTDGLYKGLMYFDVNLNRPIWWNGLNWVDSDGNNV